MPGSTVFTSNRSQAVRLPKAVAFPDGVHHVDVLSVGHGRLVVPKGHRWTDFFDAGATVTDDFLSERLQPAAESREPL